MSESLLATTLVSLVSEQLDRGTQFFRVPELVSPTPVAELVRGFASRSGVRLALFVDLPAEINLPDGATTDVATAIDWRNDGTNEDALIVIGGLDRNRAMGLADLPVLLLDDVRRRLFTDSARALEQNAVPHPVLVLLRACAELAILSDLNDCAAYCESLFPADSTTPDRARKNLWMLGLLPDLSAGEIERRRLQANAQLVLRLRTMDASTSQRLIRNLSHDKADRDYAPLRRFAATGEYRHLAELELTEVQEALRSTTQKGKKRQPGQSSDASLAQIIVEDDYDEDSVVSQLIQPTDGEAVDKAIVVGPLRLDWDYENLEPIKSMIGDPDADYGYEAQAGSLERFRDSEAAPVPGKGEVEWRNLIEIGESLRLLERRAGSDAAPSSDLLDQLIGFRANLLPVVNSIPSEGVRLFMLSSRHRAVAVALIDCWIAVWEALRDLRDRLNPEDRVYVRKLAEQLASTDLRIAVHGADVITYVLPLHPMTIEPRVRAAQLFLDDPTLSEDFFSLVAGSLDPSMPSISILVEGSPVSLAFSGRYKGFPQYSKNPRQVDSVDVIRTIQELVDRFINVHPYASISLSVGLLDPPARAAKALLRWLGESAVGRVALHIYVTGNDTDTVREALDEAREELVSGEVSTHSFEYDVTAIPSIAALPEFLSESDLMPHLLFLFDVGDVEQSGTGASFTASPLGSLVSEWAFDTDPLAHARPVIRPRTGSDRLTEFLTAQAGLFEMPLPSQERSPLLSASSESAIRELSDRATWIVLCEGVSALVPPLELGDLHLIGRVGSGNHVAFLYTAQVLLLLEPVLSYLQQSTWIDPDREAVVRFLLGTLRMALPEGLLGFFKARGSLSRESVLGRLGLAAAIAYLNEGATEDQLLVSLDTEGARRWLGLREGGDRRADLVLLRRSIDGWTIEAIEVKARTDPITWSTGSPEVLQEAVEQAVEMEGLLRKIFQLDADQSPATPSRREILKRQIFLEAFQQWEPFRHENEGGYVERIDELNQLFDRQSPIECDRRVLIVTPAQTGPAEQRTVETTHGTTPVVLLGLPWLRRAMEQQPGAVIEIPTYLLDELGGDLSFQEREVAGSEESTGAQATRTGASAQAQGGSSKVPEDEDTHASDDEDPHDDPASIAGRLREVLIARNAPFLAIEEGQLLRGPAVIQVPFRVSVGAKLSQLQSQEQDIARDLGVQSIRISNWIGHPGYAVAELPRVSRRIPDVTTLVPPSSVVDYPALALGAQIDFQPLWVALDELPHLLVAGTTGSGKSVFLRSVLWQLTNLYGPEDIELVLIDAKGMADYLDFATAPHFRSTSDFHTGVPGALELLEDVVLRRLPERTAAFRAYATAALRRTPPAQVTNLRELRADSRDAPWPIRPLVVIVDEFAELVLGASDRKRFEEMVTRFSQVARAIGGHLVAATQRPSVDVVSGVMKANFARIALRVQQTVDSRVILDESGAETLLGRGDLLFKSATVGLVRLQGFAAVGPYAF